MSRRINLEKFADGALTEQLNDELSKVLDNIYDPNTEVHKVRKLTLTLSFKPSGSRDLAEVNILTKSSLAPVQSIKTNIIIDKDYKTGEVVAAELGNSMKGQMSIDDEKEEPEEVEEVEKTDKVLDLRNSKVK